MRFNIYKEARFSLIVLSIIILLTLLFYFLASMFTSMGYDAFRANSIKSNVQEKRQITVILDAGHGGEDPGAVANGLIEKKLNLEIVNLINEILLINNYTTHLTRNDDTLLYKSGEEDRKKFYDIRNREEIANSIEDSIFVSIHMNKFSAEYCKGLQVFYNKTNTEGRLLAESIQCHTKLLQADNKRIASEKSDSIYLIQSLKMPAALIECGFISNAYESALLKDARYKIALAMSIYYGIANYMEN